MRTIKMMAMAMAMALLCLASVATPAGAADAPTDPWGPMLRLVGSWTGKTTGQAGDGTVTRSYRFVMNKRFIQELNTSTYPPQEKNKAGEVHEHRGMFSYDKARKLLVLRQFHIEGFVNTYRQSSESDGLMFESESFENFSNSWKAREKYEFISDDEFIETFELAAPGKPFETYSRNHFKRVAK